MEGIDGYRVRKKGDKMPIWEGGGQGHSLEKVREERAEG